MFLILGKLVSKNERCIQDLKATLDKIGSPLYAEVSHLHLSEGTAAPVSLNVEDVGLHCWRNPRGVASRT